MLEGASRLVFLLAISLSFPTAVQANDRQPNRQSGQSVHWSFAPPVRAELPAIPAAHAEWVHGPIDRFVLAQVASSDLSPSPPADRRTLLRRVSLDLTGLPPSPSEVRAFLADSSPDAYAKVVERLLASDAFGEHFARYWLDAARYADTHGLHLDNYREMWPYRDWVIEAFNSNKPYDEFLVEQLAGDLLTDPTLDQLIATGFNRCHVSTNEGGSIDEEVYARNVVDRVSTLGTACLGLTLGCAACHDHKYDPVSQKEFYELFAFFNGLDGPSMDGNVKDHAPIVRVPNADQQRELAALDAELRSVRRQLRARLTQFAEQPEAAFAAWHEQRRQLAIAGEEDPELEFRDELLLYCRLNEADGVQLVNSADAAKSGHVEGTPRWVHGRQGGALEVADDCYGDLGNICRLEESQPFSIGAWIRTSGTDHGPVIAKIDVKNLERGYELAIDGRQVAAFISGRWPGYGLKVRTTAKVLEPDRWHHVVVTYDGSRHASDITVYVDGESKPVDVVCDSLREGGIGNDAPLLLGRRREGPALLNSAIDDVRIHGKCLTERDVQQIYTATELAAALDDSADHGVASRLDLMHRYYVLRRDEVYRDLAARLDAILGQRSKLIQSLPTTPVFRDSPRRRPAYVLIRGQYDQLGEEVEPGVPSFLPPLPDDEPVNRLSLAKWLVADSHPLTSRVAVNRFWQQLFGTGLVKTAEDFGRQGTPPSHSELLDWLAVEFRDSGWDVKALVKQIVMSATYRQSSQVTPELLVTDPENRLLARGPRFRLDAEMLRDQALAISGLLVHEVGGPSVKPPQPGGLWEAVAYTGSNTREFVADQGHEKIHRRSLYTFWKRTAPPPQMSTFDAPSREACIVRRERTNTPLQALVLMNEPQFVEAAQHLARRTLVEAPPDASARAAWMFGVVTVRPPCESELGVLLKTLHGVESYYRRHREHADQLANTFESLSHEEVDSVDLAAWTMMANLVLNLDESLTKE